MANDKKMVEDINGDLSPQYYDPVTGKYEYLHGADGVSFTGNHVLTEGGIWVPQRGSDDGAAHTKVTGRSVEEVYFFNAQEKIDDQGDRVMKDISKFNKIYLFARNTTDVNIDIRHYPETTAWLRRYDDAVGDWITTGQFEESLLSDGMHYLMNTKWQYLNEFVSDQLKIWIKPKSTPTKGSISVWIVGVKN